MKRRGAAGTNADGGMPLFLDFEASSLNPSSYPIEVAYSCPDGEIESCLIVPESDWLDWDPYAQREIHRISRAMLFAGGSAPGQVLERMNERLSGEPVYCDGGEFDAHWLNRLAQAAGFLPAFELLDIGTLYPSELFLRGGLYEQVSEQAWGMTEGQRHRADTDVRYLQNFWRLMRKNLPD